MCIQKFRLSKSIQMYSPNDNLSIDKQEKNALNCNSDGDSSARGYALIETDSDELDHIIDLLRQFFPRTKIVEYNNHNQRSNAITSAGENEDQASSNASSPIFKGKVKDYLQRRYLEQIDERETLTKSRSLDSSSIQTTDLPSKRSFLQRYRTIDMDDSSNDTEKVSVNIDQFDDDEEEEEESSPFEYSERPTKHLLLPTYNHSSEQEQEKRTSSFPSAIQLPLTPYSASSDPGPFHSPWFSTPTSTFNFRFPQSQEQIIATAQGSIAQLSTLTKMLCNEPSVFTPISPRFKTERPDSKSSGILPCQICHEEFDSHQTYVNHYRRHLETNRSDLSNSDINCDRSNDLRNYSCKICSKRFSRSDMLNRHLRLHSGVRPYRCTMCNTNFSRSDHLSTHLRTHTGEKPYTCSQCSYAACRRDMITRHLKIHQKQPSERKNATSSNDS